MLEGAVHDAKDSECLKSKGNLRNILRQKKVTVRSEMEIVNDGPEVELVIVWCRAIASYTQSLYLGL